ncbi:MAG: Na/Pi cotransporter family protein, partial [Proteobacteria bacterium]|nr:Na/Pi cotransporter family protein [Pseudomonadota bacterium]
MDGYQEFSSQRTLVFWLALSVSLTLLPHFAIAAENPSPVIDWIKLTIGLFGGLSIFLYGMEKMSEAMKIVAGDRMKDILSALSNNRIVGMITGTLVTAVIQSSSVTTVMLVGFVTAGLMSFSQSIAIILGADIGTTITAQIVAFKVTKYALFIVSVGVGLIFFSKKTKTQQYGYMIMGLGMVFFGMSIMSDAMKPLRSYQPFLDLMGQMSNPLLGILVSAAFTGLVQSSSATTGVVIVLATQGVLSLEGGISLVLGANIGTCITAGLASLGKPREAVRVAIAHVMFKLLGVAIVLPLIPYLADLARYISPAAESGLSAAEEMALVVPRQIANSHTLFNVGLALLFIPFTTQYARLINWMVKDKPSVLEDRNLKIRYMHKILIKTPALALDASKHESQRIGARLKILIETIVPNTLHGEIEGFEKAAELDREVEAIYQQIIRYLRDIAKSGQMTAEQSRNFEAIMSVSNELEHLAGITGNELIPIGKRRITEKIKVSKKTEEMLIKLNKIIFDSLLMALDAFEKENV